jgi:hypothetical protein
LRAPRSAIRSRCSRPSGAALGLAFLSKYFAVLLGLGYLAWAIASPGAQRRWSGLLAAVAAAVPFGLVNLWWNLHACWCNVMFNAINRHEGAGWSALTPLLYLLSLAYLAAPLLWFAWRERAQFAASAKAPHVRVLALAWLVPLAVFALLSPVRRIGLHWLLSFIPALILTAALALDRARLEAIVRFFAWFGLAHAVVVGIAAALPLETWKSASFYSRITFPGRRRSCWRKSSRRLPATSSPPTATRRPRSLPTTRASPCPVFGMGTSHARQDDITTDWRAYAGKDFVILRREAPAAGEYRSYFREIEVRKVPLGGGTLSRRDRKRLPLRSLPRRSACCDQGPVLSHPALAAGAPLLLFSSATSRNEVGGLRRARAARRIGSRTRSCSPESCSAMRGTTRAC